MNIRRSIALGFLILTFFTGLSSGYLSGHPIAEPQKVQEKAQSPDDYPDVWKREPMGELYDSWGMQSSTCASWVAWKIWQKYHYSIDGWSGSDNANWIVAAKKANRPTGPWPKKDSAVVDTSFYPGHVMWVEEVYDDGKIKISEYNYIPGDYSERIVFSGNFQFIYFD